MVDELSALRAENEQLKGQVAALKWALEALQRPGPYWPPDTHPDRLGWPQTPPQPMPFWYGPVTCGGDPGGRYRTTTVAVPKVPGAA